MSEINKECCFCIKTINTGNKPLMVEYICQIDSKPTDAIFCALCDQKEMQNNDE